MNFRFIVVEDAPFLQELVKNIAVEAGGTCIGLVSKGSDVLKSVQFNLPDLVFLDMVLPHKNGADILKEINEMFPLTKVIIISSLEQKYIEEKLIECTYDSIVLKPFTRSDLKQTISKVMVGFGEALYG